MSMIDEIRKEADEYIYCDICGQHCIPHKLLLSDEYDDSCEYTICGICSDMLRRMLHECDR